ncbi:MAG: sulfur carrier protein ThiS [Phycisphaerales bacterium]|nr:sulfur carrier protein ThiS [Phycisphaerales bacterium]
MRLTVNGDQIETDVPMHVADLVAHLGLQGRPCAVEVNRALVPRGKHDEHALGEGDIVEIVTLVGGG